MNAATHVKIAMAGRGRGRGKTVSFDVQALGFGRGEALPAASLQPPPLFPSQQFKPVPLLQSANLEYMLALKQEFLGTLRKSPYFMKDDERKRDIERYTDKYQQAQQDSSKEFNPDWRRLPDELKIKQKRKRKIQAVVKPTISKKRQGTVEGDNTEIEKTLQNLEKKEEETGDVEEDNEKEEEEKDEDAENEEDIVYDEDDLEEETDYAMAYFDNGEGYDDDDGDADEGPVY